ncbi:MULTISPECIES: phosphate ABC transporter substrate-binding protein [unclassified Arsukibacterium]|uniref:phosphate ABC transporter substrate-binding protein n=1 Tax=unclassified Arsukibacterium TaxID=2635278 RepID=UPI000C63F8C5|nr:MULTISPECIES: phosphate ABC transporter substrate-binding protein [unclassified Arsukibacterium]MAA93352.1 phosphate ABC transporter substrate-binding protein [Rheinheimera sp.]MBM35294.1 phosphate ABC transporter substrate-binding protein [Rheinheimera sp.]HAW91888.1 phosphate ABC transporter substrate-binding protein [Candidatus Azambacteria bacterium]
MLNRLIVTMLVVAGAVSALPATADIAVIVNPANNSTLTTDELTRLYTGRSSALNAVNLAESSPLRSQFDEKGVGRSSAQLKAHWSKLIFTGKGTPPLELATEAAVIEHVTQNPNAIGYVDVASVTDGVKVVLTLN